MCKIGYLIPEFPGQTHIFFWRERQELMRRGVTPDLVSTRRPPHGLVSHSWSDEAIRHTTYLHPPNLAQMAVAAKTIARAMPAGISRCLASVARAQDFAGPASWKLRVRLSGLIVMGASLASLARASGWQHIHCHSCADAANIAMFAHLISGIPYSLTLHGALGTYGPNQREKWRHASLAIVITQTLRRFVERGLSGALPPHLKVAPMGVNIERFHRSNPFTPWQGQGPFRVFSCARLNPGKGCLDLVQALSRVRVRGIDARLVIAGEDDKGGTGYRAALEAGITRLGMREFVKLLGAVGEDRIVDELDRAHAFALASHDEALGVAIMEAMSMELPVVVTRVGGVPELVHDGDDGLLVDAGQPEAIAQAIVRLARDPALAVKLGSQARTTIEASFQASRSAEVLAQHVLGRSEAA